MVQTWFCMMLSPLFLLFFLLALKSIWLFVLIASWRWSYSTLAFPQSQKYTSYLVPQFKTVLYLCVHGYTSEYTRMVLGWVPPEPWNQDWVKIVGLELYPRKYQWRRAVIGCVNSSSTCKRADLTPTIKKKKSHWSKTNRVWHLEVSCFSKTNRVWHLEVRTGCITG